MHQDTPITVPSMHHDGPITRPCSRTQPQIDDPPQQDPPKLSRHSHIPTLQYQPHQAAAPANICLPSTSCIPTPHCNPFARTIDCSSSPFQDPSTILLAPLQYHQCLHLNDIYQFLTHLTAINGYPVVQQEADNPIPESIPDTLQPAIPMSPASLSVTPRSPPAPIQMMIGIYILHQAMTHNLHKAKLLHNPQQ